MTKTGLVLGGGGARGSYEVGVWEALDELSIKPDIVTGTSVGALNGALIAQGDLEEAKRLWLSVDNAKILGTDFSTRLGTNPVANISAFAREFVEHGGADASGLLALLNQNISEERVRSSPDTLFGLVTVRFPSMKPEKLFIDEIPEGKLNHYLMASSAFFPAMRAYEMDGKAFVDGGYNDNMPAKMAIDRGADQIIAVNLEAPGIVRRLGSLHSVKTGEVSVTEIKCRQHLGEILNFDSETAGRNIRFGYLDTMKAFHRLDGCRYSFSRTGGTLLELSLLAEREILHAGLDEKGNRSLRFSLARGISKDVGRERLTPLSCTMHAIDCAAHVYGADPLKIYTYDEICSFIVTEYKKSGPDPLKSISLYKTLEKNQAKTSGFAAHRLMSLSRRDVVAAFVETLRTARAKREFKRMHLAARFFPAELEAAILINCLTGKNKESTYEQN